MNVLIQVADAGLRRDVLAIVRAAGYGVAEASHPADTVERVESLGIDAVLLDLEDLGALDALDALRSAVPELPLIVIGAQPRIDRVVEAFRRGARDFLRKPFGVTALERALARALGRASAAGDDAFLTRDPGTLHLLEQLERAAETEATIRLVGESGTGKSLLARLVHLRSPRRNGPFVVVRCASLTRSSGERELFGEGRHTNGPAGTEPLGRIPAAHGGTLVLDEIGDLSLALQPKLLRVLQEREIRSGGGRSPLALDLRVVATTGRDLRQEVAAGRFREDLFYRLDVVTLRVPPLRERLGDVPLLARRFLERFARLAGEDPARLDAASAEALSQRPYRGNVRELENLMKRAALLFPGRIIEVERLEGPLGGAAEGAPLGLRSLNLRELERAAIARSLRVAGGNRTLASRALGISVRTLRNKIRLYGLA